MKTIEKFAKTVELAIEEFKAETNLNDEQFSYEVLQKESTSFLGLFGGKQAIVKFSYCDTEDLIRNYLDEFFKRIPMELESILIEKENDAYNVTIINPAEPGFIIGKDGNFLNDLEYLLNLAVFRNQENRNAIKLDVDNYRQRRSDGLVREVKFAMSKILKTKISIKLKPMTSSERRIVHQLVLEDKRFKTTTVGEGKKRQVVISFARGRFNSNPDERRTFRRPPRNFDRPESDDKE